MLNGINTRLKYSLCVYIILMKNTQKDNKDFLQFLKNAIRENIKLYSLEREVLWQEERWGVGDGIMIAYKMSSK